MKGLNIERRRMEEAHRYWIAPMYVPREPYVGLSQMSSFSVYRTSMGKWLRRPLGSLSSFVVHSSSAVRHSPVRSYGTAPS